jgi:putative ABC transport system substrate-binding protein
MFTLLETKNLELLHELAPRATVVGALANLTNPNAEHQLRDLQTAARILGLELIVLPGSNERDSSFATMAERQIGALVVSADGFLISRQDQIVELAAHYAVPTMYPLSQYIEAGGLVSYGANLRNAFLQTGVYVGRILKGTKPADLPVLQPTKLEFVINLKTAKALGLDVPPKLLALADETIE